MDLSPGSATDYLVTKGKLFNFSESLLSGSELEKRNGLCLPGFL